MMAGCTAKQAKKLSGEATGCPPLNTRPIRDGDYGSVSTVGLKAIEQPG